MAVTKQFLDELKARLRVSEVVGRKMKLTRRGREFVGLSPFSKEKTPSFTVNDDKQFWHCFSSGEHGDIISYLEKTENLSFMEAVERLAAEAGLEVPRADPRERERERKQASLIDVMEMAASFFQRQLAGSGGREAAAYLAKRGVSAQTIETFRLGYAPGTRTALYEHLEARGVTRTQMAEAGLSIDGEEIRTPYDRFRHRVMFPIEDGRGRVIAFGGRALDPNAPAKYLNSPDTPLFDKGRTLYNQSRARKPAYDAGTVLVVEGYMDVIGLAQAGFANAVAPLGTALTEHQIGLLWRLVPEPILCFDGDKAGLRAAFRASERVLPLLKPGHSLRFAFLPEGLDPDDLAKAEGEEGVRALIEQAKPLVDVVWDKEVQVGPLDTPERRADFEARIEAQLGTIADQKIGFHYRQAFREKQFELFARRKAPERRSARYPVGQSGASTPRGGGSKYGGKGWRGGAAFEPPVSQELKTQHGGANTANAALRPRAMILLSVMLQAPHAALDHLEEIADFDLGLEDLDTVKQAVVDYLAALSEHASEAEADDAAKGLQDHLRQLGFANPVAECLSRFTLKNEAEAIEEARANGLVYLPPDRLLSELMEEHRRSIDLALELDAARRAFEEDLSDANFARLQAILTELNTRKDRTGLLTGTTEGDSL